MRVHSFSVAVAAILIGTAQAAPHFPSSNNGAVAVAPRGLVSDVLGHLRLRSSKQSSDDSDDSDDKDEDEDEDGDEDSDSATTTKSSSSSKETSSSSDDDDDDDSSSAATTTGSSSTSKETSTSDSSSDGDDSSGSDDDSDSGSAATTTEGSSSEATATGGSSKATTTSNSSDSAESPATTASATTGGSSSGSSSGSLPASSGTSALDATQTIAAGGSFDGGMVMYDRGVSCTGQSEGGDSDAVFQIEAGGSLSNVIIGPNQIEGVHCQGGCTLTNVWWSAVCEDAFTVKNQDAGDTTTITGGGAFGADDKVMQHNGAGTISISDFTVETFGKLYRSCGNCDSMYERHVIMDGITATDGKELAGINSNYGDSATITNSAVTSVDDVCVTCTGTDDNSQEPVENGSGNDGTYCVYGSDVTVA